jgi:2-polyprenyl-6-hydroxyphenyl methylase/3-demethylubiquinone-9 3-methyltransferase
MTAWNDLVDWVGGYPFEVATLDELVDFYKKKNMQLQKMKTCGGGLGYN